MPDAQACGLYPRLVESSNLMHEITLNQHMHTRYSDGNGSHADIAKAAMQAGVDAVIVTDHNLLVDGPAGYYKEGNRRVLLIVGEEVHDQARVPQKNHLLVFGAGRELSTYAYDPQLLIDAVNRVGGLAFIAHPVNPAVPSQNQTDISWVDWNVQGFTGIELWDFFSDFREQIKTLLHGAYYAYLPGRILRGPLPEALHRWDDLLAGGKKVVAICGSDAHAYKMHLGPLHRVIFPYEFHFRVLNNHILLPRPLGTDATSDTSLVLEALRQGHCYIGYDLPASTRGFSFTAHGLQQVAQMGDEIDSKGGVTFKIRLPLRADSTLFMDGKPSRAWHGRDVCTFTTTEPGVYRLEAYLHYQGRRRGWIYSNPVYVR